MSEAVNRIRSPVDEFAAKQEDYLLDSSIKIGAGELLYIMRTRFYDTLIRTFGGVSHWIRYKKGFCTNQISSFDGS